MKYSDQIFLSDAGVIFSGRFPVDSSFDLAFLRDALAQTYPSWRNVPKRVAAFYPKKIRDAVKVLHHRCGFSDARKAKYYNHKGICFCPLWESNPLCFYQWCYERGLANPDAYLHIKDTTDGSLISPDNMEVLYSYAPFNSGDDEK